MLAPKSALEKKNLAAQRKAAALLKQRAVAHLAVEHGNVLKKEMPTVP